MQYFGLTNMDEITKMLKKIQADMTSQDQLKQMEKNINDNINEKFQIIEQKHTEIEKKLETQENRIDIIEREIRKKNLVFFGITESETNYYELLSLVRRMINENMNIECNNYDISCVRRLGRKSDRTRPVVISFQTMEMKIKIMKNKKSLEGTDWYIKEDYPPKILQKRKELQVEVTKQREQGLKAVIKYDKIVILKDNTSSDKNEIKGNNKRRLSETPENKKVERKSNYKQLPKKNKSNSIASYMNNINIQQEQINQTQTPKSNKLIENTETIPKN